MFNFLLINHPSVLAHQNIEYPLRRITHEDNDIKSAKIPAKEDHSMARQAKKPRNA